MADRIVNRCTVAGCDRPTIARGWCTKHYQRWKAHGDPEFTLIRPPGMTVQEAFARVPLERAEGGCLIWTGTILKESGYGQINCGGRKYQAHRVAFEAVHGPIPDGQLLDHQCRVRACVNPKHLRFATNKQNGENRDRKSFGRSGVRGVTWADHCKAWAVRVGHNGKRHFVGYFDDLQEAEKAAIKRRNELYSFNDQDREASL